MEPPPTAQQVRQTRWLLIAMCAGTVAIACGLTYAAWRDASSSERRDAELVFLAIIGLWCQGHQVLMVSPEEQSAAARAPRPWSDHCESEPDESEGFTRSLVSRKAPGDESRDHVEAEMQMGERRMIGTVDANGVVLGVERFGDSAAPLVLLAGGTTMLSWPDALCEALARGRRHVVRYDLRDAGASTSVDPEAPAYTLRDLAADAAALARELGDRPAHLAGIGVGGMVAQVAALDHPGAFSALTLAGTRPVAPGPVDGDLPDHDNATMERLFSRPRPDWSDRAAVAEFAAGGAQILGDDPAAARTTAERIWDRTPGTEPAVHAANQLGMVFARLDCTPRWRERLPEIAIPALVVHGRRDPFFPIGNGEALAREIAGARLLVLERGARAIPDAAAGEVATAMIAL